MFYHRVSGLHSHFLIDIMRAAPYCPGMDFFENIQKRVERSGRDTISKDLRHIFSQLQLPAPQAGEYRRGPGNEGLVFLQQAGTVLRVVHEDEYPLFRHRHIMRPIGAIRLSDHYRLDLQYTGHSPISLPHYKAVEENYKSDNLMVYDKDISNFCYSGHKTPEFPEGEPVMFDPQGIDELDYRVRGIKIRNLSAKTGRLSKLTSKLFNAAPPSKILDLSPQKGEEPDGQDLAYSDLRDKFTGMFDLGQSAETITVDPDAVQTFWAAMKQATQDGRLKASWLDGDNKCAQDKQIDKISKNYDQRLQGHNPVFAL